ncbi:MAG: hypothetical protein R2734_15555 [Nocardioides sp.]
MSPPVWITLAAHGHRRSRFVGDDTRASDGGGPWPATSAVARLSAWTTEPELRAPPGARTPQDAERAVAALLALDRPPTAIMAARQRDHHRGRPPCGRPGPSHQIALVWLTLLDRRPRSSPGSR